MNLSRPINYVLLNSVPAGTTECEVVTNENLYGDRKAFLLKTSGTTLLGNIANEKPILRVNVLPGRAGTVGVTTLHLTVKHNVNLLEKEFAIKIIRKAKFNGSTGEFVDRETIYNYVKKSFSTSANGDYDDTDVADILQTLVARINADKQLNQNAILTGSLVTAEYVAENGAVPAYIKLTSKDCDTDFVVAAIDNDFAINDTILIPGVTVKQIVSAGKASEIAKLFPIKSDDAGTMPVIPVAGVYYSVIECVQTTDANDNVVPSGVIAVNQTTRIYLPVADADALTDNIIAKLKTVALKIYKNNLEWTE